jgi:adenylyltransferase/sulfurtransferase
VKKRDFGLQQSNVAVEKYPLIVAPVSKMKMKGFILRRRISLSGDLAYYVCLYYIKLRLIGMKSITSIELSELLKSHADIQLIDVREEKEHAEFSIGGELIPLSKITQQIDHIEKDKQVVLYCKKGVRSQIAIQRLQQKMPFKNLINLTGGIDAWKKQFTI